MNPSDDLSNVDRQIITNARNKHYAKVTVYKFQIEQAIENASYRGDGDRSNPPTPPK